MNHDRYHRQKLLPDWGEQGQQRIRGAHALVVGVGALGCVSADLLVRAGVGCVTLVDRDVVEFTNLQRQTLYTEQDAEKRWPKADAARRRLAHVNSSVRIEAVVADFTATNAESIALHGPFGRPDLMLDGLDSFETRYLLNDLAVREGIAYFYAGAVARRGTAMAVLPDRFEQGSPCLRCVFRDPPPAGSEPTCDTAGVLGPLISVVAGWQTSAALDWLASDGVRASQNMITFDLDTRAVRTLDTSNARDPECPCCGQGSFEFLNGERFTPTAALCGRNAVQIAGTGQVNLVEIAQRLGSHGSVQSNPFLVRALLSGEIPEVGEAVELSVFRDGRALVEGVTDAKRARSLYARYIGC